MGIRRRLGRDGGGGTMVARDGRVRRLIFSVLAAALLLTLPPGWQGAWAVASDGCSRAPELRATTCRLVPGQPLSDTLAEAGGSALYRVDALTSDSSLNLTLAGGPPDATLAVLNWRGEELASASRAPGDDAAHLAVGLKLPGAYGVRVTSPDPASTAPFEITAGLDAPGPSPRAVWPPAVEGATGSLASERRNVRTLRGAVTGGPGVGRESLLGAPPATIVGDFTLVADVEFEQIVGASALTVRFRFEPEAGGGSGYFLSLDPVAGEATLDSFEEGRSQTLVAHARLPVELGAGSPRRLIVRANGQEISTTLDGQAVLTASDGRYPRGLIAVGAVTWSDPAAVIFDHL